MSKEVLDEYKLREMKKRFKQIAEYSFITKPTLSEEGDDDNGDGQGQQPPQQVDTSDGQENMGQQSQQDTTSMGDAPQNDNGQMQQADIQQTEPQGGEEPQQDGAVDTTQMQDGDEVIDVDDLTNAQEDIEYKIDGIDDKLVKMLKVVDRLIPAIEDNMNKIEDLRADFDKRNPTEEEKLNLRSMDSYPYNVKPQDYWANKAKDGNYNIIANNDVAPNDEDKEYVLKHSDMKNVNPNDASIYKSFNIPDQMSGYFDLF